MWDAETHRPEAACPARNSFVNSQTSARSRIPWHTYRWET